MGEGNMIFTEVEPIQYKETTVLAGFCGVRPVRTPIYKVSDEAKRLLRVRRDLGLTLRRGAARCSIKASELSGLETGRLVVRLVDYAVLLQRLEGEA